MGPQAASIAKCFDRLTQTALAPGAAAHLSLHAGALLDGIGPAQPILDVGCGFASPLVALGRRPVGVDIDPTRTRSHATVGLAAAADAALLPFPDHTFAATFSFGMLHHLADVAARRAIGEMQRVVLSGGLVAIFDGVLPERVRDRPAAAVIRALDRGSHMRSEPSLRALFDESSAWRFERVTYAATGLEGVWCVRHAPGRERG